jgi:Tol biopolymer transport system component
MRRLSPAVALSGGLMLVTSFSISAYAQSPSRFATPVGRMGLQAIVGSPASLSGDGRFVAFESTVKLVPADVNESADIYVLDRETGKLTLESVTPEGRSTNGSSNNPHLSADGRWLLFESSSTNLLGTGAKTRTDLILRDRLTGTMRGLTRPLPADDVVNSSGGSVISADGKVVAFASHDTMLVADADANGGDNDVYVLTIDTGRIVRASVTSAGVQPASGSSFSPSLNADGTMVAFTSSADLDRAGAMLERTQVWVRDLVHGTTRLVSAAASGGPGNMASHSPSISGDGRLVAFSSGASNLGPSDDNKLSDIYVRDVQAGTTTLVSRTKRGKAANGDSSRPAIAADGQFVAFVSEASDLTCQKRICASGGADDNLLTDVYLADLRDGSTRRLSGDADRAWWAASQSPAIDAHGTTIVFPSREPIDPRDVASDFDLFLWIRLSPQAGS